MPEASASALALSSPMALASTLVEMAEALPTVIAPLALPLLVLTRWRRPSPPAVAKPEEDCESASAPTPTETLPLAVRVPSALPVLAVTSWLTPVPLALALASPEALARALDETLRSPSRVIVPLALPLFAVICCRRPLAFPTEEAELVSLSADASAMTEKLPLLTILPVASPK